jgi:hypothetical protein
MRSYDFSLAFYLIINDYALEIEAVDAMLMKQAMRLVILPHALIEFDLRGAILRVNDSPGDCARSISFALAIHITIEKRIAAVIVNFTVLVVDAFAGIEALENSLIDLSMLDIAELYFVQLMSKCVHFFNQICEIHRFYDLGFSVGNGYLIFIDPY